MQNPNAPRGDRKQRPRRGSWRHLLGTSKPLPRRFPSLSWLRGIVCQALGLGSLLSFLVALLNIPEQKDTGSSNAKPDPSQDDLASLPNQKWVVRKRNHRGQLRHVQTYDHPPSRQELVQHGIGSFSILTTKPSLKSWESLEIQEKWKTRTQQPPVSKSAEGAGKPPTRHKDTTEFRSPKKSVWKKRPEKTAKEPHPKDRKSIDSVIPSPKPSVKDIKLPSQPRPAKESSIKDRRQEHLQPEEQCERCLKPSSSVTRCDFCGRILCNDIMRECFEKHDCVQSTVCAECGRRIRSELVEIADVCRQFFCSPKCMSECKEKHPYKFQCLHCEPGLPNTNDDKKGTSEARRYAAQEKEARGRKRNEEEADESDSNEVEDPDTEDGNSEHENGEEETEDGDDAEMEESTDEDYVLVEMCNGKRKDQACLDCQEEHCNGRYCHGSCSECNFDHCEIRCENDGVCKTCEEFDDCSIRCMEALEYCDKRHCDGFECRERFVSGMVECDNDCASCDSRGCYFWDHFEDG